MSQYEHTNTDHSIVQSGDSKKIMVNGVDVDKLTFFGRRKLKKNMAIKESKEKEIEKIESVRDGSDDLMDRVYMNRIRHLDNQINIIDKRIENALSKTKKSSRPIKLRYKAINVITDVAMFAYNKVNNLIHKFKGTDDTNEEKVDAFAFAHENSQEVENAINEGFNKFDNDNEYNESENYDDNLASVEPEIDEKVENSDVMDQNDEFDDNFTNIEVDEVEVPDFNVELDVDSNDKNNESEITDIDDNYSFDDRIDIQIPMEREEIVAPMNITKDDLTKIFDDYMKDAPKYDKYGSNIRYEAGDLEYDEDNEQAIRNAYNEYQEKQNRIEEEVNKRYLEQIPAGIDLNEEQETQIKNALRKQIKAEEEAQKVKEELEKAEKEAAEAERSVEEAKNRYAENILRNIEIGINKIGEEKEKYTLSIDKTHDKMHALEQEKELFINKQNEIDSQREEEISKTELNSMLDEADEMGIVEDTIVK